MTGNAHSGPHSAVQPIPLPGMAATAPRPPQPRLRLFSGAPGVTRAIPDARCTDCRRRLHRPTPDGLGPVCRRRRAPATPPHPTIPALPTHADPIDGQDPSSPPNRRPPMTDTQPITPTRLAEIREHDRRDRERGSVTASMVADIADHRTELLAEVDRLTPRQITDIDEIDAFPVCTILLEHIARRPGEAMAWRKERDGWWYPSTFSGVRQRGALAMAGVKPLLIHTPDAATAAGDTEG